MNILRRPPPPAKSPACWKLDAPFIALSANKGDRLTLGDCFEHFAIFGGTGSGKSSGSARTIAKTFLNAQMGGTGCS